MPTYRLDLAYDGSAFHGYALQPKLRTVQGDLEAALAPYTGGVPTFVAGRTDKGVHAAAQVVSFACPQLDTARVVRSLNAQLAPEIAVSAVTLVDDDFHARFSATGRAYRYRIRNAGVHQPLTSHIEWLVVDRLDVEAMHEAVAALIGEHDFAAFCRKTGGAPTTRRVEWVGWLRESDRAELAIGASSFCHQMVRSVVAVSVDIGRGRLNTVDMETILRSRDRSTGRGVAPPHGLTLSAVAYGEPLDRPDWVHRLPATG